MADVQSKSPITVVNDTTGGVGVAWINANNAKVSDNTYATCQCGSGAGELSNYLKATDFGFNIPSGATIEGIKIQIENKWANGSSNYGYIESFNYNIIKGGLRSLTNLTTEALWTSKTDVITSYGGQTNLCGETWTVENINASDFGFAMAVQGYNGPFGTDPMAYVDQILITVYYTAPPLPNIKARIDGALKTYSDGQVRIDGVLRQVDSIWARIGGVLKKI